jgi:uncharacterized RDD family membrane protein YckC
LSISIRRPGLLICRALAFVIDAILIGVCLTLGFSLIATVWHVIGPGTFDVYSSQRADIPRQVTWLSIWLAFAFRDAFSDFRFTALRWFGLSLHFRTNRRGSRTLLSLVRAGAFFLAPVLLIQYDIVPWDYMDDSWVIRSNLWSLFFVALLFPLSIAFSNGHRGLHDLLVRSYVSFRSSSQLPEAPPLRRIIGGVFLSAAFAGVCAITLEIISPRTHAQIVDYFRDVDFLMKGISSVEPDGPSRTVVNLSKDGVSFRIGTGTNELLASTLPSKVFEQLNAHVLEWQLITRETDEAIPVRNGPDIPTAAPYLHASLWVTREAFQDHFIASTMSHAVGTSLLEENVQFSLALVSLLRITRVGPVIFYEQGDLWVAKDIDRERFILLGPDKRSHHRAVAFRLEIGDRNMPTIMMLANKP